MILQLGNENTETERIGLRPLFGIRLSDDVKWMIVFLYMGCCSLVAHLLHQSLLAAILLPVPLFFIGANGFNLLVMLVAGNMLFFESYKPGSGVFGFMVIDGLVLVYVAMVILFPDRLLRFKIPKTLPVLFVVIFTTTALFIGVIHFNERFGDYYYRRDMRNLAYLIFAVFLCRNSLFGPKRIIQLLIVFVGFTALHAIYGVLEFIGLDKRIDTWNELFFPDAILMAIVMLRLIKTYKVRMVFYTAIFLCGVAMLTTQTRSTWLSLTVCLGVYVIIELFAQKKERRIALLKTIVVIAGIVAVVTVFSTVILNKNAASLVAQRMESRSSNELINPTSSLGFRLYEAYMVWRNRSIFGQGPGGKLLLYSTLLGLNKWVQWWCVHSSYFDMLNKYGFFGLGMYLTFIVLILYRSIRMALNRHEFMSVIGIVVLLTMLNHLFTSLTSPYLVRESVMVYLVLVIVVIENLYYRNNTGLVNARSDSRSYLPSICKVDK